MDILSEWRNSIRTNHGRDISIEQLKQLVKTVALKQGIDIRSAILLLDKKFYGDRISVNVSQPPSINFPQFTQSEIIPPPNSCYMDSVLFCLFKIPIPFIKKNILNNPSNIQQELQNISKTIHVKNTINVGPLRSLLMNNHKVGFENFATHRQQDADEFLKYLFSILNVECCENITYKFVTNVAGQITNTNVIETEKVNTPSSPVFDIFNTKFTINQVEDILPEKPIKYKNKYYSRMIQITKPLKYEFMVVHLNRTNVTTKISPATEILGLQLYGIVVWDKNHYYSLVKLSDNEWIYYDDMQPDVDIVKDIYSFRGGIVLTNGILYFYK